MVEKAKIFYFTVFILVVAAFIFHVTAMGHHHWKKAVAKNSTYAVSGADEVTIGLFTRCTADTTVKAETCTPNLFPTGGTCDFLNCLLRTPVAGCSCDFLQSAKAIAACAIIAAIFLGLSIIILFIHSINTSETRSLSLILGLVPLLFLILAFAFILTTLILVGCFLSRDMMHVVGYGRTDGPDLGGARALVRDRYTVGIDWSSGLEIIALVLTFFAFLLYSAFVFKFGRAT